MLTHTIQFKEKLVSLGKQQDVQITFGNTTLGIEDIVSVKPNFKGNILKTIMQGIDIRSYVEIPKGTIINVKWGLKIDNEYEYLEFNNYEVYSCEKEENSNTYYIIAYDKLIKAKENYTELNLEYPITLKQFIIALAEDIGLTFTQTGFVNENRQLNSDKFKDIGYNKMDVLDDIAEATASTIIVKNGELILAYIESNGFPVNETLTIEGQVINEVLEITEEAEIENEILILNREVETFDEEYIKTNLAEFKTFGPINSVVLSRSVSDNIYRKDDTSIENNGLYEIIIKDNQLLNDNNRENYIEPIYNRLHGLSWTICDFTTVGIGYLEPLDNFLVKIRDNSYLITLFSRTFEIEDGAEENIYVEEPKNAQTDYKKASQTENDVTLIVNKQTKEIQGLITQVGDRTNKTTSITADLDSISAKVEEVADLTNDVEGAKYVNIENAMEGNVVEIHVFGNNEPLGIYPSNNIFPSENLKPLSGGLDFYITDENDETKIYEFPNIKILRANGDTKDEFIATIDEVKIIRRVNSDGTIKDDPVTETLETLPIIIPEGNSTLEILTNYYIKATYVVKNAYRNVYSTKAELSAELNIEKDNISSYVRANYVGNEEVVSKINQSAEAIQIEANKIALEGYTTINGGFTIDEEGNASIANGTVNIDTNGIQLASGTKIVGGNGMLTQFQYSATGMVGHVMGASVYERIALFIPIYIPENFIITGAYIQITHTNCYYYNLAGGSYQQIPAYSRNVKLYRDNYKSPSNNSQGYIESVAPSIAGELVSNLGDENGKTFASNSPESIMIKDISDKLNNGMQYFYLADYTNTPIDWEQASAMTGVIDAHLFVQGYLQS